MVHILSRGRWVNNVGHWMNISYENIIKANSIFWFQAGLKGLKWFIWYPFGIMKKFGMITTKVLLLFYAYPKCCLCISENTPLNPISSKSCHTPTKTKIRKPKKSLFPEDHIYRNTRQKTILAVLDSVLDKLQEYDYNEDFVIFLTSWYE